MEGVVKRPRAHPSQKLEIGGEKGSRIEEVVKRPHASKPGGVGCPLLINVVTYRIGEAGCCVDCQEGDQSNKSGSCHSQGGACEKVFC